MTTRAAALAAALSLLSSSAFAGVSQRFAVGAVVVASATVTSSVGVTARDGAQVQIARHGAHRPMLLVADGLKPMPESGLAKLSAPVDGQLVATVLY
jgi:hypothetical protein